MAFGPGIETLPQVVCFAIHYRSGIHLGVSQVQADE